MPSEIVRLARIALANPRTFVFGFRAKSTVNNFDTSTYKLAKGNIFSLLVSTILGNRLADSQCGLKFSPIDFASEKSIFQKPFNNQ